MQIVHLKPALVDVCLWHCNDDHLTSRIFSSARPVIGEIAAPPISRPDAGLGHSAIHRASMAVPRFELGSEHCDVSFRSR